MRRCQEILLRLLRGPATTDELRTIIRDEAAYADEQDLTEKALQRRFDEDKRRLQEWFHIELRYNRTNRAYELYHIGYPLLDLSDDSVRALAFLEQTYSSDGTPMAAEVRALVKVVMMLLPHERLKDVQNMRGLLEMELGVADDDEIVPDVWEAIKNSTAAHRQLEFDYHSPRNTNTHFHRHRVEPTRYFFDTSRRHYYLECFGIQSTSSQKGIRDQKGRLLRFRLGRIRNPIVLPTHFSVNRRIPTKELIYELTPDVARSGVTRHFPDMRVHSLLDGGARVIVDSRDLFFDLRKLLHYGGHCKVIGGEEAVREMKALVQNLHQRYFDGDV